jgi:hypothetical protein
VLHNYLRTEELTWEEDRRLYCPAGYVDENDEDNGAWRNAGRSDAFLPLRASTSHSCSRTAKTMRDNLAMYFSGIGSVPWQTERAGL